jgi:hypothetical protein
MKLFLPHREFAVALLSLVVGCNSLSRQPAYPADPLFAMKKPQEVKAENAAPAVLAATVPEAPPVPAAVLAARKPSRDPGMLPEYRVGYPPSGPSP